MARGAEGTTEVQQQVGSEPGACFMVHAELLQRPHTSSTGLHICREGMAGQGQAFVQVTLCPACSGSSELNKTLDAQSHQHTGDMNERFLCKC